MIVEVDQSIEIELTSEDSVLALASINTRPQVRRAPLVPAAAKRKCLETLKRQGRPPKSTAGSLFAAAVHLLLQPHLL